MNHPPVVAQQQSMGSDPSDAEAKQQLADEIARIEEELERKRLEDEIKRMEQMIAAHKSSSDIPLEEEAAAAAEPLQNGQNYNNGNHASAEDIGYYGASDADDEDYYEEEVVVEDDDDYDEEEEEYDEEEIIEEEVVDDDGYYEEEEYDEVEYVEDDDYDDGYEDFGGQESCMMDSLDFNSSVVLDDRHIMPRVCEPVPASEPAPPPPPPPLPGAGLMSAISGAATARNERLEADDSQLIMKDHTPETQQVVRPMDTFDLTAMVSQKARERETRLEAGEKIMTPIKSKAEYKMDFNNVALEAAELGRLTRLNEVSVESVAVEKTPEEEWRSKGLLSLQLRNQHISIIHEAARAGAAAKLPEKIVSNWSDEEQDDEYDESNASQKRVSERMKQLLQLSGQVGTGHHKVDSLIMRRKEEKVGQSRFSADSEPPQVVRPMSYYEHEAKNVKLPRRKPPKVDPAKQLEKIKAKFRGTYREDLPLSNISNEVAERAWARRTRLDRPGSLPRVQEVCNCPYCLDPTPFQTHAYKEKDKERKAAGYVSPDSEEERQKAREKRRLERRKNRPQRGAGRGAGAEGGAAVGPNGRIRAASTTEGVGGRRRVSDNGRAASAGRPARNYSQPLPNQHQQPQQMGESTGLVREEASGLLGESKAPPPARARRIAAHSQRLGSAGEVPGQAQQQQQQLGTISEASANQPRTTGGKIGAAAKNMTSAKAETTTTTQSAPISVVRVGDNGTSMGGSQRPEQARAAGTRTRRVVRRRRRGDSAAAAADGGAAAADNGEAAAPPPPKPAAGQEDKPVDDAAARRAAARANRASRRPARGSSVANTSDEPPPNASSPKKRIVRKKVVDGSSTTSASAAPGQVSERIITKSDGTRVVQKVTTASPKKVVTKKVIVRKSGGKKVETTSTIVDGASSSSLPAMAPPPPPPPSAGGGGGGPAVTTTRVTTNKDGRRVVTRISSGDGLTPVSSSAATATSSSAASPRVTVTKGASGRVVTTTTTTTTRKGSSASSSSQSQSKRGIFGRKKQ